MSGVPLERAKEVVMRAVTSFEYVGGRDFGLEGMMGSGGGMVGSDRRGYFRI